MSIWDNLNGGNADQQPDVRPMEGPAEEPSDDLSMDELEEATRPDAEQPVGDDYAPASEPEPEPAAAPESEPTPVESKRTAKPSRASKSKDTEQGVNVADIRRIIDVYKVLEDEKTLECAKLLTDCPKGDEAVIIERLMTAGRNSKVAAFREFAELMSEPDADDDIGMLLMSWMARGDEKAMKKRTATLFAVLNILAPERGFGKPKSNDYLNAKTIKQHWGDGVDLSPLFRLKL